MPTNARRRRLIDTGGPWGTGLLLFGICSALQGVGYLLRAENELPRALDTFGQVVPISWWAALWVLAGCYAVFQALTPPQRHRDVWPLVSMTVLWSFVYLIQWIVDIVRFGNWLTSTGTGAFAWGSLAVILVCWGKCVNPPAVS